MTRCSAASAAISAATCPIGAASLAQLKPLLDRFGNNSDFTLLLFTLDETTYSRELAPLGGTLSLPQAGAGLVVP